MTLTTYIKRYSQKVEGVEKLREKNDEMSIGWEVYIVRDCESYILYHFLCSTGNSLVQTFVSAWTESWG